MFDDSVPQPGDNVPPFVDSVPTSCDNVPLPDDSFPPSDNNVPPAGNNVLPSGDCVLTSDYIVPLTDDNIFFPKMVNVPLSSHSVPPSLVKVRPHFQWTVENMST